MTRWERWRQRPQTVWLRKAAFQIHLWTGLVLCLYVVMLSITGSLLVYRAELIQAFDVRPPAFDPDRHTVSEAELRAAAARAFPDHTITGVSTRMSRRDPTFEIWLERDGEQSGRLYDPYTGEDLGDAFPVGMRVVMWTADLHDNLLLDRDYRAVNGVGAILVTLLTLTGAVVWWPGIRTWRRALTVTWRARWPRVTWDLHSASGFWLFLLILNWSVTGIYLAFPSAFVAVLDFVLGSETAGGFARTDALVDWLTRLHVGRWSNPVLKALWFAIGLVPALLAITGVGLWSNRAVRGRAPRAVHVQVAGEHLASAPAS